MGAGSFLAIPRYCYCSPHLPYLPLGRDALTGIKEIYDKKPLRTRAPIQNIPTSFPALLPQDKSVLPLVGGSITINSPGAVLRPRKALLQQAPG